MQSFLLILLLPILALAIPATQETCPTPCAAEETCYQGQCSFDPSLRRDIPEGLSKRACDPATCNGDYLCNVYDECVLDDLPVTRKARRDAREGLSDPVCIPACDAAAHEFCYNGQCAFNEVPEDTSRRLRA